MKRILILLLAFLPIPALAIDVNNPPHGIFSEDWYAVMLMGAKSGHMHATMERVKGDKGDLVRTSSQMTMIAGRGESAMTVKMDQQTEESLDGKPLAFKNRITLGRIPMVTEGRFADGKVTITGRQFGIPTDRQTYTLPKGALMSWGLYREQIDRGLKPGTKYDLSIYDPSMAPDKLTTATVEVFDREQLDLFGRKVEAIKTRQTMRIPRMFGREMTIPTTIWVTDDGDLVKLEMNVMDIPVEMIACPKAAALAKDNPADLMGGTLITVKDSIDREADQLTFRLEWNTTTQDKEAQQKEKPPEVPETAMQKTTRKEPGRVTITNTRYSARPAKAPRQELSKQERDRCLSSSPALNYKDPTVAELAQRAAGDEKDPWRLAQKLRKFVSEYIRTSNLNVGFATASEVARSKEGDCTEYGILLAALGRAAGIPTRIATGYVYTDQFLGRPNVFVGHLWTQFFIDGQWVDLDAALRQDNVDPTHIALAISDASDASVADLVGSVWIAMGKPSITLSHQNESTAD